MKGKIYLAVVNFHYDDCVGVDVKFLYHLKCELAYMQNRKIGNETIQVLL